MTIYRQIVRAGAVLVAVAIPIVVAAAASPIGTWDLTVEWPPGPAEVRLEIRDGGSGLEVEWSGVQGRLEGKSVSYSEGELSFALEVTTTTDGSTFDTTTLPFKGRIDGDGIEGSLRSPNGGSLAVSGSRRSGE